MIYLAGSGEQAEQRVDVVVDVDLSRLVSRAAKAQNVSFIAIQQ